MSLAFIFPGQGGQFVGQGLSWVQREPNLKEIFDMADDLAKRPISRLCFEGPADELAKTANLQPAVLAVSLAALRLMRAGGTEPAFAAGHSLGEFGALCAARVIDEETALSLVSVRGRLMEANAAKRPGAMMAVIGLPAEELAAVCELAGNEGVVIMANFNTPEQIVISGEGRAVAAAGKYVKMKKGKALPLPLSGGFHSPLMSESAEAFAAELEKVEFKTPSCPVFPNATGLSATDPAEIKKQLASQITSPVLWTQTVKNMLDAGADSFLEAWPKAYLGSMTKKCLPKDTAIKIGFQE